MKKKLSIAISPCPNDTFIFENIYKKHIVHDDVKFVFHFLDIEQLNDCAAMQSMDIIKVSYAQSFMVEQHYERLTSGGAMGFGVGPLLLKKQDAVVQLNQANVAIPGKHTTANFLLRYLYPEITTTTAMRFDTIEDAIKNNVVDVGLVIHESRFTYQTKGLEKIADLGELWQQQTALPIPLGCIVIKKSLGTDLKNDIEKMIADSIPDLDAKIVLSEFIKNHAQEMDEQVMQQHIQLYVNKYSKHIGEDGLQAIKKMKTILKK
jgi:1,4-dihydroxy-6-naphthoate synthase